VKGMILAAGEGRRLRPLTENVPKPMLRLGGQPLLSYHIALLRAHGVVDIAVNLHHKAEVIREHFGDGSRYGVRLTYSFEQELLGSAGAVKRLQRFFDQPFFVLYGDVLTDIDLAALATFHARREASLTMALHETTEPTRCGIVEVDAEMAVQRFVEKPAEAEVFSHWANAGIYVVEPSVLDLVPEGSPYDFGSHLIPALIERGSKVSGFMSDGYFLDIGSIERYEQAERDLARGAVRAPELSLAVPAQRRTPTAVRR
jgi:NDP-sugar pyrophosphorylase family protein